jgi:hypothetical protein
VQLGARPRNLCIIHVMRNRRNHLLIKELNFWQFACKRRDMTCRHDLRETLNKLAEGSLDPNSIAARDAVQEVEERVLRERRSENTANANEKRPVAGWSKPAPKKRKADATGAHGTSKERPVSLERPVSFPLTEAKVKLGV